MPIRSGTSASGTRDAPGGERGADRGVDVEVAAELVGRCAELLAVEIDWTVVGSSWSAAIWSRSCASLSPEASIPATDTPGSTRPS